MKSLETKNDYSNFTWGTVIKVHTLGEYDIVEYLHIDGGDISFKPFINGLSYPRSYGNLEQAIIGAIATRYDGGNTKADTYFLRAIEHPTTKTA